MTRLLSGSGLVALVAVLALLAPPAGAIENNWFNWRNWHRYDYDETPTGGMWYLTPRRDWLVVAKLETTAVISPRDSTRNWAWPLLLGDPGRQKEAVPQEQLWLFVVLDSLKGTKKRSIVPQWRYVTWFPGDPHTPYYGPWRTAWIVPLTKQDTVYATPLWHGDSLAWFHDVQFRLYGSGLNESTYVRLGVTRRYWR